ncbi:metal ABC transporter permease [Myxococcota bacterium]
MLEAFGEPLVQRVLVVALLTSLMTGMLGTYVVTKRMASVTGGLAHAAFGGVGLGYLLGFDPMLGATGFSVLSGLGVGLAYRRVHSAFDTSISMVWSGGMALGVILVALAPGYAPDLTSYLFGNILFAGWDYALLLGAFDLLVVVLFVLWGPVLEATSFDEEFCEILGLPVEWILLGMLTLLAAAVVALIRVAGVILAIALLTVPAATARHWAVSIRSMMLISVMLAAASSVAGLLASYWFSEAFQLSVPPGPTMVLLALSGYGLSSVLKWWRDRRSL